jgi:predicted nucleotidyltransferase
MNDTIAAALFGKTRRAILALLFGHPERSFYLRQIVREAEAGVGAVHRELQQMTAVGLLTRAHSGRQVYFQANPQCPVFAELRLLIAKTAGVGGGLKSALLALQDRIVCAFIFGSMASGQWSEGSDIDLMVVGRLDFGEVVAALYPVQERLSREINPTVYPEEEFRAKLAAGHHFLSTVLAGEKLFLVGGPDELEKLAG